ncbi:enolase C-terminal domain-like protein [uncultured Paludibaculum sp.]|uniref:enolase C-terminal domain-like protein n=1 Tax=uncultured Paludibaculum sp. TaxID=1765020 RepID=UPI002AAB40F3|nr:enolase C-terminal domain-like protein [uncultured Paludibaculum sp.]
MQTPLSRRSFVAALLAAPQLAKQNPNDIRVEEVSTSEESYIYRTPLKFGGTVVDRVTLLNVKVTVRNRAGKTAHGFGSMPLGNVWSYPSKTLNYDQTLEAMRQVAVKARKIMADCKDYGHPVELNYLMEPEWLKAAGTTVPKLCTLVTCSPFDAAVHDAYGKLNGRSTYRCYTREFLSEDLGRYLGKEFSGEYLEKYVLPEPKPRMPLYHLVGAVDPIVDTDIPKRIGDGLPETLPEWIAYNGLTHIKIKLNGDNEGWDRDRILKVDRVASESMAKRGTKQWFYSLDFNEKCPNVAYLMAVLRQVDEKSPAGFARIQYVEQPTARDLRTHRANVMHEASKLRPVVIDESLTDLENLMLAREMGYTGAALKACKGQAQALLMAAAAQKWKMFLCVQDLTCPGASLIHSAGLAAHVPGVAAIEANARQYVPAANKAWESKFPGIFVVKDGQVKTGTLTGPGLGAVA